MSLYYSLAGVDRVELLLLLYEQACRILGVVCCEKAEAEITSKIRTGVVWDICGVPMCIVLKQHINMIDYQIMYGKEACRRVFACIYLRELKRIGQCKI